MNVGFIGLGMQGAPMAKMISRGGFGLHLWARRRETLQDFASEGATIESDAATLAKQVDCLCICVTSSDDVEEILYGGKALQYMRPGAILCLHSTVSPSFNISVAERAASVGVSVLDAPVSGSAAGALAKRLVVFVGGAADVLARVRPILETYANPIIHFGDVGAGSRAKLVNNLLMIANLGSASRALDIGAGQGLDPLLLHQALLAGTASSFSMGTLGRCQNPDFAAHARQILIKDHNLALSAASGVPLALLGELAEEALSLLKSLEKGERRFVTDPGSL
jgi:3-hydroxyisobutyrate dehydrogenase